MMNIKQLLSRLIFTSIFFMAYHPVYGKSHDGASCCTCLSGVSLYGDWLYWNARRSNLDYAIPITNAFGNPTLVIGKVHVIEPNYHSGFRLGAIKECGCMHYELRYTRLHAENKDSLFSPDSPGGLGGTRIHEEHYAIALEQVNRAVANWKLGYDQIDLLAGYTLCRAKCVSGGIFGGFTWARIDQELGVNYFDQEPSTPLFGFDFVQQCNDMNAYGIHLGVEGRYCLWNCLNCIGTASYQALLGRFDRWWNYLSSNGTTDLLTGNLRDCSWEMTSVLNFMFGLEYHYLLGACFADTITIALGYEFHHWLALPDFLAINGTGQQMLLDRRINFDFDGLFLRCSIGF